MRGKNYVANKQAIDRTKTYTIEEAVDLIKAKKPAKFNESIDVHLRLGIDPKKGDQQIRTTAVLPHGTGKTKKVAVFVPEGSDFEKKAKELGADIVGGKELINKIKTTNVIDFDIAVAVPDMMKDLAQVAKVLGPKGLMPSPKNETVTNNLEKVLKEIKAGKITIKNDELANVHQIVGKASFEKNQLVENAKAFLEAVKKVKPSTSKGTFIRNAVMTTTMGPAIRLKVS